MTIIQPPTFIAGGCYEASSFRHLLSAAANGSPGVLEGLDVDSVSSRDITIGPGSAIVPGAAFSEGFYQAVVTAAETVTVAIGAPSGTRPDLIIARIRTTEFGDGVDTAAIEVVVGNATTGQPGTLPDRSLVIATVNVPAGATSLTIDDVVPTRQRPGVNSVPVGAVVPYAGPTAPDGWLLADGAELSKVTYPALFDAIGTTYGEPTGSTFSLPDLRGRTVVGAGDGPSTSNRVLGTSGGAEQVTLTTGQMPSHNHTINSNGSHSHAIKSKATLGTGTNALGLGLFTLVNDYDYSTQSSGTHTHSMQTAGSNQAHENMPPYEVLNYIIRVS